MSTISGWVIHSYFYDFSAKTILKTPVLHVHNTMKNNTLSLLKSLLVLGFVRVATEPELYA